MILMVMAIVPIITLFACLLIAKTSALKASSVTLILSALIAVSFFKVGINGLSISLSKGFGLSLFVLLIIWSAIYLYNFTNETNALSVISKKIGDSIDDRYLQFLVLSWIFSSFLQGIAGFGVPLIVVIPILIGLGFDPYKSASATLIGHAWSISFGSMGSSIYAINLVTDAPLEAIILSMSLFGIIGMFCTGVAVTLIYEPKCLLMRIGKYILPYTLLMGIVLYILAYMAIASVIGLLTGLSGLILVVAVNRIKEKSREQIISIKSSPSFIQALLPYILVILFSVTMLIADWNMIWGIDYPGYITGRGRIIPEEISYVSFNLLKYPFTIIAAAILISSVYYRNKKILLPGSFSMILRKTWSKCKSVSITIALLLGLAVIMMDSGMVELIARGLVAVTGFFYPFISPFIGMLGAFITGSNTNSNILFGSLQEIAALNLGLSSAVICAAQSIGASIGGGIGPTTVTLAAAAAGVPGDESKIYKITVAPVLITGIILGLLNLLVFN